MSTSRLRQCGAVLAGALLLGACGSAGAADSTTTAAGAAGTIPVVASTNVWGNVAQHRRRPVSVTSIISDPVSRPALLRGQHPEPAGAVQGEARRRERRRLRRLRRPDARAAQLHGDGDQRRQGLRAQTARRAASSTSTSGTTSRPSPRSPTGSPQPWARPTPADAATFTRERRRRFKAKLEGAGGQGSGHQDDQHGGEGRHHRARAAVHDRGQRSGQQDARGVQRGDRGGRTTSPRRSCRRPSRCSPASRSRRWSTTRRPPDPQTEKVEAAAKAAGIAVVPVTETLPTGKDYLELDDRQRRRARERAGQVRRPGQWPAVPQWHVQ